MTNRPPRLLYVNDPLCGWCFALRPALEAAVQAFAGRLHFETLDIVLWWGSAARIIEKGFREHLEKGVPHVESVSRARFGDDFRERVIANDHYVYESGMTALANQVVKAHDPLLAMRFVFDVQDAFFVRGESANDISTFVRIGSHYGIDSQDFVTNFHSATTLEAARSEQQAARALLLKLEVSSVPQILVEQKGAVHRLNHEVSREPQAFVEAVASSLGHEAPPP